MKFDRACSIPAAILLLVLLFVVQVLLYNQQLPVVDGAVPHPHHGVVKPFVAGDPGVQLNREALSILKKGKPYTTQIQDGTAGRGLVVQDVKAPVSIVWSKILDFDNYTEMVPKTLESKIYKQEALRGGKQRIWVRMEVGFALLKLQFYINHLYDPVNKSMTWTLDYSNKSDLNDSAGYWFVIPHPDNPLDWSRVYYSVEVSMFDWVPKFVVDFMSKQALTDATGWVQKFSEEEAVAERGSRAAGDPTSDASDATCDEDEATGILGTLPARLFGLFGGKEEAVPEEVEDKSIVAIVDSSSDSLIKKERRIGASRYALIFSILSLSLYNVHLYFSQ